MIVYLLLITLSLSQVAINNSETESDDNIREAVLKYMFDHDATQQHPFTKVFFIAIDKDKDPPKEFMKKFEGHNPRVKKLSQSTYTSDTGMIVDEETGGAGIRYSVGVVKWINETEARLEGSYYVGMLFAGGCEYRIVLEGSQWVVKGCEGEIWRA